MLASYVLRKFSVTIYGIAIGAEVPTQSQGMPQSHHASGKLYLVSARHPSIATKRIAGDCFSVQCAQPAPIATDPGRAIGDIERNRLALDCQLLVYFVREDRDVVGQKAHFDLV